MDQQPKIPTLKDAQKPQVKIKGMGAGLTLFDRLKQFKKKDLAFILAGLGTLFMAPLAEHFMMAPENGDSSLKQGWGGPGSSGAGIFGNGSSPYESGNNGIAQGGAIGGGGDIITPLNVRDPSALVMGPGGMQQPPAGSAAPATPPPTAPANSDIDYKNALNASASRALGAAVKKSPLPVPKVALGGSGLRGLGVAGGGTSASGSLGPINSGNLGQAGTGGGGLNLVRTAPGYRSAGARGSGNPTGLDGTKKAGANAGDAFSRTGSALGGLQQAASEAIPTGGSGFSGGGQGGAGANDKAPGGGGPGGSKSVGESLAFIEAKERMMENLKLEFEKRKLKDPELLLYGIRNDSLKAMASEMTKSLTKGILGFMDPSAGGAGANYYLCGSAENGTAIKIPLDTPKCDSDKQKTQCMMSDSASPTYINSAGAQLKCQKVGDGKTGPASATETGVANTGPNRVTAGVPDTAESRPAASLESYCTNLRSLVEEDKKPSATVKTNAETILGNVDKMVAARIALYGEKGGVISGNKNTCTSKDTKVPTYDGTSVAGFVKEGILTLDGETTNNGVFKKMLDVVGTEKSDSAIDRDVTKAKTAFENAEKLRKEVDGQIKSLTAADLKVTSANETADMKTLRESAEKALTNLQGRSGETGDKSSKVLIDNLLGLGADNGLMLATKPTEGTLDKVIATNKKYKEAANGAKGAEISGDLIGNKDLKGLPDSAGGDASAKWKDAATAIEGKVTTADGPIAALKNQPDPKEKEALVEPAKKATQEARKAQIEMITGIRGGVQALRNAPAPAAGTPGI